MNVLIVYAHPEPHSFNGAMRDAAIAILTEQGHDVVVSDLYAMNFQAAGGPADFLELGDPQFFKYQAEQTRASEQGLYTPDVAAEHQKLQKADLLIFQFPLWWFGLPALLKGWVDRVFAVGVAYGGGRWYDNGVFAGRKAMLSLTTGGPPSMYSATGLNGAMDELLFPIQHGMLRFVGFDVLPPFIAWGVGRATPETREQYLNDYAERLRSLDTTVPIKFQISERLRRKFRLKIRCCLVNVLCFPGLNKQTGRNQGVKC